MKTICALAFAATIAAAPFSYGAESPKKDEHHPDSPAAKTAQNKPGKTMAAPRAGNAQMEQMDEQMKAMREMHEKMMAAKTPEERNALMAEHMKSMQDGMSMMNGMMGGKASNMQTMPPQMMQKQVETMQKQMDMMQMTMQMMMDRIPPPAK